MVKVGQFYLSKAVLSLKEDGSLKVGSSSGNPLLGVLRSPATLHKLRVCRVKRYQLSIAIPDIRKHSVLCPESSKANVYILGGLDYVDQFPHDRQDKYQHSQLKYCVAIYPSSQD